MEIVIAMFHTIYMRRMERRIDGQAVQQIDRLQRRRRRIPRFFRPRSGLDALSDIDIIRRFRLSRESIERLYNQISGQLEPITFRTHALPGMLKLLAVLHFLATGSFQSVTSIVVGMSQPSFSRHLTTVIDALLSVFKRLAGIPNVLGAIDCTHVRVRPPHLKEEMYRNRKFYHSLNIQMVCDAGLKIMSVRSGFPGSCHDSYILKQSALYNKFEEGQMPEGWLLGMIMKIKNETF